MNAAASATARYRPLEFGVTRAVMRTGEGGATYLRAEQELGPFPERMTDRLSHWAETVPERTFMARRVEGGDWRHVSYAEALASARSIGQALLDRGLSPERPVLVLSENDLEHALLALGCPLRRHSVFAAVAGLFAGQQGFRQTAPRGRDADAGPGVRVRSAL